MPDLLFADADLAALYDQMNPGRADFTFYLPMIMAASSVLDVGCGTGTLLHAARDAGHAGRLCGLDPAAGMLAQARRRVDIDWVLGDLRMVAWKSEFDFAVMTGHAFQVLLTDDDVQTALAAVRAALVPDGRFAFETRNPPARAWETWGAEDRPAAISPRDERVRMARKVTTPFDGDVVSFSHTFTCDAWERPRVSHSTLRFLDQDALNQHLLEAGLTVEARFGDWDASPVSTMSPELITVARRG